MNLSKNLIVALLGLGCYARSNSINLANNTTILLIILALLAKNNTEENGTISIDTTRTTNVNASSCPCSANSYNTPARVVCTEPYTYNNCYYTVPRNSCHYVTPFFPYPANVSYCNPCTTPTNSWNYPQCNDYHYPCHNILY